jgi:hypothetical protein
MFDDDTIAGSWNTLAARLQTYGTVATWATLEPDLAGMNELEDLVEATHPSLDPGLADRVFGALLRLAAPDAGDDTDALLLLIHLLSNGIDALAARLSDLHPDPVSLVVGELTCQIRTYPWRRRQRAHARGLLLDTRRAVLKELCPGRTRTHPSRRETPIDMRTHWPDARHAHDTSELGDHHDVTDLLEWAARRGIATRPDLALLLEAEHARDAGKDAQRPLAAAQQTSERTLHRRRARTLRALQNARGDYLATAA